MSQPTPNPASTRGAQHASAAQPYGGDPAAPAKTLSIVSLVLALASIFLGFTFLVPIAGVVTGAMALKREPAGRTIALWGLWLSIAMLALGLLLWLTIGGIVLASLGLVAAAGA